VSSIRIYEVHVKAAYAHGEKFTMTVQGSPPTPLKFSGTTLFGNFKQSFSGIFHKKKRALINKTLKKLFLAKVFVVKKCQKKIP